MQSFSVIGGGAWGTACAQTLTRAGHDVTLWAREDSVVEAVNTQHENTVFLPGVALSPNITATSDIAEASMQDVILLVCPAQHMRATLENITPHMKKPPAVLIICAKGIEIETGALMSSVVEDGAPDVPYAVMSGPTFAAEVAMGKPAAVTLACKDKELARQLADVIGSKYFRPYVSGDPIGAEIGGAVKNVIAIACGIVHGMGLGDNSRAAILTRGLVEINRLGAALGANKETLMGMCGIGDLTLTCTSMQSRNFSLGVARGQGKSLNEILASRNSVTEGVATAAAIQALAQKHAVDMPICAAVNDTLNNGVSVQEMLDHLLSRPLRDEAA